MLSLSRKETIAMRTSFARGAMVSVGLMMTVQAAQAAEKVNWAKSLETAMVQAKKTNRLVMADFYTDW
jgi:hypothetical protein